VADLVELEVVQELVELPVLFLLFKLEVVLLKTVEGQLGLVIDVDLEWLPVSFALWFVAVSLPIAWTFYRWFGYPWKG
jgi:hypothetical protein